ncbi:MAG: hypothetical protein OXI88_07715, partial [Gammaproteobacteria bacterium]|nr:hypothetical protein [Gammaproteobacteria bacterium]
VGVPMPCHDKKGATARQPPLTRLFFFGELCSKVPKMGVSTSGTNVRNWSQTTGLIREQIHVSE